MKANRLANVFLGYAGSSTSGRYAKISEQMERLKGRSSSQFDWLAGNDCAHLKRESWGAQYVEALDGVGPEHGTDQEG